MRKLSILILFLACRQAGFFRANAIAQEINLSAVDQLLIESLDKDAFSGTVIIAKQGTVIYSKSVGYVDWEKKTSLNDSTLFNVGSIGKDFTQVVIAQLVSEGKVRLDDPLSKYLKLFGSANDDKITVRMLLRHQSGLGDYHLKPFSGLQDRLDYIRNQPLNFPPGTEEDYSNSGYVVLAAVIEKVTGKSYDENVQDRIFHPLEMKHSSFIYPGMNIPNKASGTEIKPNGEKMTEHEVNDLLTPSGDGGEYSTASDLLKFFSSLQYDNRILNEEMKRLFFSQFESKSGYSLARMENAVVAYAGGFNGWNTSVDIHFGAGYTIISCSNLSDTDRPAEELNFRISQIIRGKPYDAPRQPRFVFAYQQWKKLGTEDFIEEINNSLKENNYDPILGPYFYNQIASQLIEDNQLNDAVIILKENINLFPDAPAAYQMLTDVLVQQGRKDEAIAYLKEFLSTHPDNELLKRKLKELED